MGRAIETMAYCFKKQLSAVFWPPLKYFFSRVPVCVHPIVNSHSEALFGVGNYNMNHFEGVQGGSWDRLMGGLAQSRSAKKKHWGPRLSILCLLGDQWGRRGPQASGGGWGYVLILTPLYTNSLLLCYDDIWDSPIFLQLAVLPRPSDTHTPALLVIPFQNEVKHQLSFAS